MTIELGRQNVRDQGSASSCSLVLRCPTRDDIAQPFDRVAVDVDGVPRFTGWIAETALDHGDDGTAWQRISAVGSLASWGYALIGEEPWPEETVAARAQRIAAIVGEPIVVQGGSGTEVIGQDVDAKRGIVLLEELAKSTGGWLFDGPDGTIYLQALGARSVTSSAVPWNDEPEGETWDALDEGITWQSETYNPYRPLDLDGCWVRWSPAWSASHEVATVVRVVYGTAEGEQVVQDDDAIAEYGRHEVKVTSRLAAGGDAITLGTVILGRNNRPYPALAGVTIDMARLPRDLYMDLLQSLPGIRVTVHDLPQPAPAAAVNGVIEGWRETIARERRAHPHPAHLRRQAQPGRAHLGRRARRGHLGRPRPDRHLGGRPMRLSPRYLFPIAEGTDPRRNHPSVVDGPRTEGIEAELSRIDDQLPIRHLADRASGNWFSGAITVPTGRRRSTSVRRSRAPPRSHAVLVRWSVRCRHQRQRHHHRRDPCTTSAGSTVTTICRVDWLALGNKP